MDEQRSRVVVANTGALMADLVAGIHALVTENEKGELLDQRVRELQATLGALALNVEHIRKDRST